MSNNKIIRDEMRVAFVMDKTREARLANFEYVKKCETEKLVKSYELGEVVGLKNLES